MKEIRWFNRVSGVSLWLVAFGGLLVLSLHIYQFVQLTSETERPTETEMPVVKSMGNPWLSLGHTYHKKAGAELCNQYHLELSGLSLMVPAAGPPVPYISVWVAGSEQTLKLPAFGKAELELPVSAPAVYILGLLIVCSSATGMGAIALVLWLLGRVLKNVEKGRYFSTDNKQKLQIMGAIFIAFPVVEWLFRLLIFIAFFQKDISMQLPEGWGIIQQFSGEFQVLILIPGLALVALARIFEAGSSLEEESKLTI